MVYFNEINSASSHVTVNQSGNTNEVTENKKVKVIPIVQNSEDKKADDIDKLPQGYYIEKSQEPLESKKDNNDDDDINTSVNPNDKIEFNSIALEQADQVDDAIKSAYVKGLDTAFCEDNKLEKALTMIKNDPYEVLNKDFKKGLHGTVISKGEATKYSIDTSEGNMNYSKLTRKVDANFTYESKSGNTKLMFFGSGTKTDAHVKMSKNLDYAKEKSDLDTSVNDTELTNDEEQSSNDFDAKDKYSEYSLYIGGKQKIGKDTLSSSVLHLRDNSQVPSNTTQVDLKYDMDKYNATIKASTIIYNSGHRNIVQKTDLSCDFNTKEEDNIEQKEQQEQPVEKTQEQKNDNKEIQKNNKKWQKKGGIGFDMEVLNYEYEPGLHYQYSLKRKGKDSVVKVVPFAGVSTIQRKEGENSYSVKSGVIFKCNKNIGANSSLQTSVDVKDKITIVGKDKGNIFTTNASVKYRSRKLDADINAKYIVAGQDYAGVDVKLAYKPVKEMQIYLKGNLIKQQDKGIETNDAINITGAAIQGGVCVNF